MLRNKLSLQLIRVLLFIQTDHCQNSALFHCFADKKCIFIINRCDENVDCSDGADEKDC